MTEEARRWLYGQAQGLLLILVLSSVLALGFNAMRPDGLPLVRDWEAKYAGRRLPQGVLHIGNEDAAFLLNNGAALFVDARDPADYREERIPGALNLPVYRYDEFFPILEDRLLGAGLIVLYCSEASCHMSDDLADKLVLQGFINLGVYIDGLRGWKESKRPTEKGPPPEDRTGLDS